jgi:NAD-dependent SIR2 family protein deacetylase
MVLSRGGVVVNINPGATELTGRSTLTIKGKSGIVFPAIVREVRRKRAGE